AQVEGGVDGGVARVGDERAVGQLLQDVRAAAGDVLLLPRGPVGGAHEPTGGGGVGAALAHAGAAVDGGGEVPAVLVEREAARHRQQRPGVGPAQVRVERRGTHEHTGVELLGRVEQRLDLPEHV